MEVYGIIFKSVYPLFFLILFGFLLARINFIKEEVQGIFTKFAYWIALPVLIFDKVSKANFNFQASVKVLFVVLGLTALQALILFIILKKWKVLRPDQIASGVQGGCRGNLAFISLPILIFLVEQANHATDIIDVLLLVFAPTVMFYNLSFVPLLIAYSRTTVKTSLKDICYSLISNPLLISCALGLFWGSFSASKEDWLVIDVANKYLGGLAFPMALLGLGCQMFRIKVGPYIKASISFSLCKVILLPLIGLIVSRFIGLDKWEQIVVVLLLGSPTAVASYVIADQLQAGEELAAGIVVISTAIGLISIPIFLQFIL
ncbi:MAG: AEC family transporter [Lentisphaeria bacterium]|nr:AEC family transporter [Lentisphaeria bacterium]